MHSLLIVLTFGAAPLTPAPALTSFSGLNVAALKPWLIEQLPSLAQCVATKASGPMEQRGEAVTEGDDEVSVQAQFGKSPEVSVMRVDAKLSDAGCVRGVVDRWKRDAKQPSAGSFAFKYRFRPSEAQRKEVAAASRKAFTAMCPLLPSVLTIESVKDAMAKTKLPLGMQVWLEDTLEEAEAVPPAKLSVTLSRALRDLAESFKADQCIRN